MFHMSAVDLIIVDAVRRSMWTHVMRIWKLVWRVCVIMDIIAAKRSVLTATVMWIPRVCLLVKRAARAYTV